MKPVSLTKSPTLDSSMLQSEGASPALISTLSKVSRYLGVGVAVQTETGGETLIRFNTSAKQLEYYADGAWHRMGGPK